MLGCYCFDINTPFFLRAEPAVLTPSYLMRRFAGTKFFSGSSYFTKKDFAMVAVTLAILGAIIWGLIKFADAYPNVGLMIVILFGGVPVGVSLAVYLNNRKAIKRLQHIIAINIPVYAQVKQASSARELLAWMEIKANDWLVDSATIRSILCYVETHFFDSQNASKIEQPGRLDGHEKLLGTRLLAALENKSETSVPK